MVIGLYLLVNLAYLCTLPLNAIQHAESDRVATATLQAVFPGLGVTLMALAIMVSTFGCINGMLLTGSRAYYAMARDGLFFQRTGILNRAGVPGIALLVQGLWAAFLVLPRTYDPVSGKYGNLYSNLLDYVVSAVLIFYILTIIGIFRLRRLRPLAERPYKTFRLSRGAGALYCWRERDSGGAAALSGRDDFAGAGADRQRAASLCIVSRFFVS